MADPDDSAPDVPSSLCMRCARGDENTHRPAPIPARILWPALGFPAVIDPKEGPLEDLGDAARCVFVLILANRWLSKAEVAQYLRYVPWDQRHTRYLPPGADHGFLEEEIRSVQPAMQMPGRSDEYVQHVSFGADQDGENGVVAGLSKAVLDFYAKPPHAFTFLLEVRIYGHACTRLAPGLYNLFWINGDKDDTEEKISQEMDLLLREFATPQVKDLAAFLATAPYENLPDAKMLLRRYEYEFGEMPPYNAAAVRAEVPHPLFIKPAANCLKMGHMTDVHVDIRSDVYEANLKETDIQVNFSNWNRNFDVNYKLCKDGSDIILLTGDLVDYGRGHLGIGSSLGEDQFYLKDRNWFLFYYLFASGDLYQKPAYTILGNHDWRINPYTPASPGTPNPKTLINDYLEQKQGTKDDHEWYEKLQNIINTAHGPGYEKKFSYDKDAESALGLFVESPGQALWNMLRLIAQTQTMNQKGLPSETTVESVIWYLLLINPFLDYKWSLPGGFDLLMLDWGEKENVLFPIITAGVEYPYMLWTAADAAYGGPRAKNCLTNMQKQLVQDLMDTPGKAKTIGIHAPPVGPHLVWSDDMLLLGRIETGSGGKDIPGRSHYQIVSTDGTTRDYFGHPLFAVSADDGLAGQAANYGSIEQNRAWFIQETQNEQAHVRLVLSGHIHRNDLIVVHRDPGDPKQSVTGGQLMMKRVIAKAARGAHPPAVSLTLEGKSGPLYVNTTSGGPRGNGVPQYPVEDHRFFVEPGFAKIVLQNDGTIVSADFLNRFGKTFELEQ